MVANQKKIIVFFLTVLALSAGASISSKAQSQNIDEGIQFYRQKQFKQAVNVFSQIKNSKGYLFAGKSLYALGNYSQAQAAMNNISGNVSPYISEEATFISALIQFQQKKFTDALSNLYVVQQYKLDDGLSGDAADLYGQIVDYLSPGQRMQAMKDVSGDSIRFNLLTAGMGKMNFKQAKSLYDRFDHEIENDKWKDRAAKVKSSLDDSISYQQAFESSNKKLQLPKGTIYTIGLAMPKYKQRDREFATVKAIYLGALLAAKNYNEAGHRAKAVLKFVPSGENGKDLKSAIDNFVKNEQGDALIGPLFSRQAKSMISIAEDYHLPTITPLANDKLDAKESYLFQANPTFEMHGKKMASYAVNMLKMHNLAILANENSKGAISARAFRENAEKLGANVNFNIVENFQSNNYQLSQSIHEILNSTDGIDAVYAPFTDEQSHKLIDLMLNDFKEGSKNLPVFLGSQAYDQLKFGSQKYHNIRFYYTEGAFQNGKDIHLRRFKSDYQRTFGSVGNQYSMVSYDVAHFILQILNQIGNPALLKSAIAKSPKFNGLTQDLQFNADHVNEAVKVLKVTPSGKVTVKEGSD